MAVGSKNAKSVGKPVGEPAARAASVPVASHAFSAAERSILPHEAAVAPVPAVRSLAEGSVLSSPAAYLSGMGARVSSAASTLLDVVVTDDSVVTDDRYARRQLLGLALLLMSLSIGAFPLIFAAWRAIARHKQHGQSEDPAGPAHGDSAGGSAGGSLPEGPRRNGGMPRLREGSAARTKPRKTNRRRKVVDDNSEVSDASRGWQIGEDLRRSLGGLPLRPDAMANVLAELKPQVEDEMRSLALVERRRPLSDREHRQESALRDLLALAQENASG